MVRHYLSETQHPNIDWVLSPELARSYDPDRFSFEEKFFPCGVTGQKHFPHVWPSAEATPEWVRLVPMPDNDEDACALRVIHDNRQIGWVPSGKAYWMAPYICLLEAEGSPCKVPLTEPYVSRRWDSESECGFTEVQIGVMLLPNRDYLDAMFNSAVLFAEFDEAWELLRDEEREEVRANGYRFDDDIDVTTQRFRNLAKSVTKYPFVLPVAADWIIDQYLVWYRRMIDKYLAKRRLAERNLLICESVASGRPINEIATEVGLKPSTVSGIRTKGNKPEQREEWLAILAELPANEDGMKQYVLRKHF